MRTPGEVGAGPHGDHADHGGHEHDVHDHGDGEHGHAHGHGVLARVLHAVRPHSHDPSQATDAALEASEDGIRAVKRSLVILGATAALQGVIFVISGSVALLADTVHNLSDALTALPLWLAFVLGRRPPSRRFPYGLGRVEDLAGLVVVLMIAVSAVVAGWESLRRLTDPQPVRQLAAVALAGVIGFAGNEVVAQYRIRVGRRISSAALVADGMHARTDGFTSLGVVVGAAGVALGYPIADPLVGLVITVAIVLVLVGAVRDVGRRLLDGVDPAVVGRAESVLAGSPGVEAVEEVKLRWVGHHLHAEAVVAVDGGLDVSAAHDIASRAAATLRSAFPQLAGASVHVHPAVPGQARPQARAGS
jgi:cation diffusion facilitator family transporter